jgi:hypothetical protein
MPSTSAYQSGAVRSASGGMVVADTMSTAALALSRP